MHIKKKHVGWVFRIVFLLAKVSRRCISHPAERVKKCLDSVGIQLQGSLRYRAINTALTRFRRGWVGAAWGTPGTYKGQYNSQTTLNQKT